MILDLLFLYACYIGIHDYEHDLCVKEGSENIIDIKRCKNCGRMEEITNDYI